MTVDQPSQISLEAASLAVARALRLPPGLSTEVVAAQAVRRAAAFMAPCSRNELRRAVEHSLQPLFTDIGDIMDDVIEDLIVYGDLLELRPFDDEREQSGSFVLRASPPCFVRHHTGAAFLVGVAGDEITPLPDGTNAIVRYRRTLRVLEASDGDIPGRLSEAGIPELSAQAWLRTPPSKDPKGYIEDWKQRLRTTPHPSAIDGLTIFIGAGSDYYPARRVTPLAAHDGIFIGRRSQKYGADLWCIVHLEAGAPVHLLDLVSEGDRLRPCDVAWRILCAMDAASGDPQRVRLRKRNETTIFDFFAPIPSWAQRRLVLDGSRDQPDHCLMSFAIPTSEITHALQFLHEKLWIETATPEGV